MRVLLRSQMSTDAPASAADPPPPCPGSRARSSSHHISGLTLTQAKQSKCCCPPLPPWAASTQRKPTRQRPDPDASRVKQAPLPPPCRRRRRRRCPHQCPRMCHRQLDITINTALPPPPKQLCCFALPFFLWEWGRGGKLFGEKQGVYFFLKMELIQLYVQSKTIFYYPFLVTKTGDH